MDLFEEIDCGFYLEGHVRCTYLFLNLRISLFSAIFTETMPLRIRIKRLSSLILSCILLFY